MNRQSPALIFYMCVLCATQPVMGATISESTDVRGEKQCTKLVGARIGSGKVQDSTWVEKGTPLLGFFTRTALRIALKGASAGIDAGRDFCRVTAELKPAPGSTIVATIWLPEPWNGKLLGVGGGGFNGGLEVAPFVLKAPLEEGYAGVASDAGHDTTDSAKFAYNSAEPLKDYGYRANHEAAVFAKALIESYYQVPAKRAYFHGCSNGGRDALMLARRYPKDYDGIIAGAPAANFTGLMSRFIWNQNALDAAPDLEDKLQLLHKAIIAKCDAIDGVKDGVLENPQRCDFDPGVMQCENSKSRDCLSAAEVSSLRKIYHGPRLPDGTQIYPGQPVGGEGVEDNWSKWMLDLEDNSLGEEGFRWMVFRDPGWSRDRFDLARDSALAEQRIGNIVNSDDPDISGFIRRGGKLMLYHGWNDVAIPAGATIQYYNAVQDKLGSLADKHVRLYMIPGLMHCGGGPGATYFDKLSEMDRWVESDTAPERIIATQFDPPASVILLPNAKKVGTRPLCPWPQVAHYKGSGPTNDEGSFRCK